MLFNRNESGRIKEKTQCVIISKKVSFSIAVKGSLSCPLHSEIRYYIFGSDRDMGFNPRKKIALSISMTFGIQGESLCLCLCFCLWKLLSCPGTSVTGAWEVLWQSFPRFLKKRALSFTLTLGVLSKSLLSLKLLSCPGICGTGACVFSDYSPILAFVALGLK